MSSGGDAPRASPSDPRRVELLSWAARPSKGGIGRAENGPRGGIILHLDALAGGVVVASDTVSLGVITGRDNLAFKTLSVAGSPFDQLRMYATFGDSLSGPRVMLDNLTLTPVPAPGALAVFGLARSRRA